MIALLLEPPLHVLANGAIVLYHENLHERTGSKMRKIRSPSWLTIDLNASAMIFDDPVADRQAEAGSPPGRFGGVKRFEDLGLISSGDSDAVILDFHNDFVELLADFRR